MRNIKYIHPDYKSAKPFDMAIDLANVSTILKNGDVWDLRMENGERISMEASGDYFKFVDECQAAKTLRDLRGK